MESEVSESGSPVYRHGPRKPGWTPPDMVDSSIDEISAHIEAHIGPISMVWHELLSDLVHIDVYQVAPTPERPCWTLITSGMSDKPMQAPDKMQDWRYAELMICLPPDWKMSEQDFKDERWYWPVRWLKMLARFPHEYDTWFFWGHTLPNGNPPSPFHRSVKFDCMMLMMPLMVPEAFCTLPIREDKVIHFYSVVPLYPGETALKLKKGAEELERRFDVWQVSELLDVNRRDVSYNKPWWKFWG